MSGTRYVIKDALMAYGFSDTTADGLIDELMNGHVEVPEAAERYGVMEAREGGCWEIWDRAIRKCVGRPIYTNEAEAQYTADSMNAQAHVDELHAKSNA